MSLLLNGAKTITIAGTEMQCIEIYTGESYTLPFSFKDGTGAAINCTGWTLATSAKWYSCTINYTEVDVIDISNLTLDSPQPSAPAGLTAAFTTPASGIGYIFLPSTLSGGTGSPNPSPTPTIAANPSILCIITLTVTRTDPLSTFTDTNREPIGVVIRYQ